MAALPQPAFPPAFTPRIVDAPERSSASPIDALRTLVAAGRDRIPLPGHGATLHRWQRLAAVAATELALVKLYESHVDALAILHEIDTAHTPRPGMTYAVWASEAPGDPLRVRADARAVGAVSASSTAETPFIVTGRKSWCSGSADVDVGLLTAIDDAGRKQLVEVDLAGAGVAIDRSRWQAVGMQGSGSFDLEFDRVPARLVGPPGAYLDRPGFWHGGAGIAACWFGAAAAVGGRMGDLQRGRDDPHALAHLGPIDGASSAARALLREAAREIDAHPARDAARTALRVRTFVAQTAETVLQHAARALGPGPLCNEAPLAHLFADLPIFIRQSKSEHDLAALARGLLEDDTAMASPGWTL